MAKVETPQYDEYINEPNNQDLSPIPGDMGLPLIGHTHRFYTDPYEMAKEQYKKYGTISRVNALSGKGVMALGPDNMQRIYLDQGKEFSSKMGFMDRVGLFFSGSVIMEDFDHHKHQRRILQSAFKSDALKTYTEEINEIYDRALQEWDGKVGTDILFFDHIKNLLLEVAAAMFIGVRERGPEMEKLNQAFIDCVNGTMYILPYMIPGTKYYKGMKGREYLLNYMGKLVPERRANPGTDMLSYFCQATDEDGNYFSEQEIVDQAIFLLFAAHDTTTAAITHTIYYLAQNPDIKEKVYQECVALGKDSLDYEDLDNVPYMQQVFYEIQRIRTSTPIVPRRTIKDIEMDGIQIPAHTMVYTVPRFTHHMEEYWKDADKFDPDRFSPERAEHKAHPFCFHPFGGGAHKCIGMHFSQMEYKCFLYKFILKFDFIPKSKKEAKLLTLPLPKPSDGLPIELIRR